MKKLVVAKSDRSHSKGTFLSIEELEHKIFNYNQSMTDADRLEDALLAIKSFLIAQRDGYASEESLKNTILVVDNTLARIKKV